MKGPASTDASNDQTNQWIGSQPHVTGWQTTATSRKLRSALSDTGLLSGSEMLQYPRPCDEFASDIGYGPDQGSPQENRATAAAEVSTGSGPHR
ncbi:hypothetical protein MRX96_055458 [Rhipicephalus microplus]